MEIASVIRKIAAGAPQPLRRSFERLEASPIGKRLARGAFWAVGGTLISRGLNMLAMILVARVLGKSQFGELGIIQSTVVMFQTLAGFGLGYAATKYVAEFRKSDPVKAGKIIAFCTLTASGTGGLLSIIFFLAAPWLAVHVLAAPDLVYPLKISSLILFLSTLAGTQTGVLAGFEAFDSIAKIGFVSGVLSLPLIVGGALILGVEGAVWGMILTFFINWVLNRQNLINAARNNRVRISWKDFWQVRRILWDYSLPSVLGGTLYWIGNWAGGAFLVNQPDGFAEMGYFNAANQWFSAILFLPGVLGQAAIPVLSERLGMHDLKNSKKILLYSCRLNAAVLLPVIIVGCLCSPWIMNLYGADFRVAWPTLVAILIASGIAAMQAPAYQIIIASGRIWMAAIMNSSWAIIFVLLALTTLQWGSLSLAIGKITAYVFYAALSFKFSLFLLKKRLIV